MLFSKQCQVWKRKALIFLKTNHIASKARCVHTIAVVCKQCMSIYPCHLLGFYPNTQNQNWYFEPRPRAKRRFKKQEQDSPVYGQKPRARFARVSHVQNLANCKLALKCVFGFAACCRKLQKWEGNGLIKIKDSDKFRRIIFLFSDNGQQMDFYDLVMYLTNDYYKYIVVVVAAICKQIAAKLNTNFEPVSLFLLNDFRRSGLLFFYTG